MSSFPRKVVIDTDPGIDDAVAILFALGQADFDVLGITTVAGNIGIRTTTRNAGRILALAGRGDIPVVAGAAGPLARKGFDTIDIHGAEGLGGAAFPEPLAHPHEADASAWLADLLDANPPGAIDILALGPLTNIARLILDRPRSARRLGRVIAMGGAIHEPGNVGPRAEFNIAADPEAAGIVFASGLAVTLVPLDVTRKVRATRADTQHLRASGIPAAMASADLIDAYFLSTDGGESRPLHDPCVILLALRPCLFAIEPMTLTVDTSHGRDAGALALAGDPAPRAALSAGAIDVAMRVDGAQALDLLLGGLMVP